MKNTTTTTNAPVATQAAFTPGPWEIEGSDIRQQGGFNIATMRCFGTHALAVAKAANARLIAAAPELIAALQIIHANAGESPEWIRRHASAAIAKATGGAQ